MAFSRKDHEPRDHDVALERNEDNRPPEPESVERKDVFLDTVSLGNPPEDK